MGFMFIQSTKIGFGIKRWNTLALNYKLHPQLGLKFFALGWWMSQIFSNIHQMETMADILP
jgi:hypothetical protein